MNHVRTRTSTQSRSHAQKFLAKISRKGQNLKQFLNGLDFTKIKQMSAEEIGFDEDLDLGIRTEEKAEII